MKYADIYSTSGTDEMVDISSNSGRRSGGSRYVNPNGSNQNNNKKKIIIIASSAAAVVIAIVVACIFIFFSGQDQNKSSDPKETVPKEFRQNDEGSQGSA